MYSMPGQSTFRLAAGEEIEPWNVPMRPSAGTRRRLLMKVEGAWRVAAAKSGRLGAMVGMVGLAIASSAGAAPANCPLNMPVMALAPHQVGGFSWGQSFGQWATHA
jgi:hypothetical protein